MARVYGYFLLFAQIMFLIAAGAALALCTYIFGIPRLADSTWQLAQQRNNLQMRVIRQRAENKALETFRQKSIELSERIETLREQIDALHQIVPEGPAAEELEDSISKLAGQSGVQVRSVATLFHKPLNFYIEVPFEVKVGGSYTALTRFFDQMARLPRIVNIWMILWQPEAGTASPANILGGHQPLSATCVISGYAVRPRP